MILRKNIRKNKETYTSLYLCGAIWLSPTKLSNGQPTNIKTAIPGMIEIEEFFEEIEILFLKLFHRCDVVFAYQASTAER